jgi:hypothetical protein
MHVSPPPRTLVAPGTYACALRCYVNAVRRHKRLARYVSVSLHSALVAEHAVRVRRLFAVRITGDAVWAECRVLNVAAGGIYNYHTAVMAVYCVVF